MDAYTENGAGFDLDVEPGPRTPGRSGAHEARSMRIAAAGDIHCRESRREEIEAAFDALAGEVQLVLLAGDLTTHGDPARSEGSRRRLRAARAPHDRRARKPQLACGPGIEITETLQAAGVTVLDRGFVIERVGDTEVGIVGTKGFVGGFTGSHLPDFGEPLLRAVYAAQAAPQLMPAGLLVTVPLPVPVLPTDKMCCTSVKLAVADRAALIVTTHVPVPLHAPLHPAKVDPAAAVAVSVTAVLSRVGRRARGAAADAAGLLVTVPLPVPVLLTDKACCTEREARRRRLRRCSRDGAGARAAARAAPAREGRPGGRRRGERHGRPGRVGRRARGAAVDAGRVARHRAGAGAESCSTDKACCTSGVKLAVAVRAALIVTTHAPVPLHAPLQPAKVDPAAGVAVRVTAVPAGRSPRRSRRS